MIGGEKEIAMNVVQPIRGEKGATPLGLDADSHGTQHRAIVDTHRHPWEKKCSPKYVSEACSTLNMDSRRPTLWT